MPDRFLPAAESQLFWGNEGTKYTKAASMTKPFGLIRSDVDSLLGRNPYEAKRGAGTGTKRKPHTHEPQAREYPVTIEYEPLGVDLPLHAAMGKLTTTAKDPDSTPANGDEYTEYLYELEGTLPTISIGHQQKDIVDEWLIGCKSDLSIRINRGEAVRISQAFLAIDGDYDDTSPDFQTLTFPTGRPFRFDDLADITVKRTSGGASVKTVATLNSAQIDVRNGLEVRHHGKGRAGHSVVETDPGDGRLPAATLNINPDDLVLFKEAEDDGALVDVSIPLHRPYPQVKLRDALIINLKSCKILNAGLPHKNAGDIRTDIQVLPLDMTIEGRVPA